MVGTMGCDARLLASTSRGNSLELQNASHKKLLRAVLEPGGWVCRGGLCGRLNGALAGCRVDFYMQWNVAPRWVQNAFGILQKLNQNCSHMGPEMTSLPQGPPKSFKDASEYLLATFSLS